MHKFKVGDRVRVKSKQECLELNWKNFMDKMIPWCGKNGTVKSVFLNGDVRVCFPDDFWDYLPEMLELLPDETERMDIPDGPLIAEKLEQPARPCPVPESVSVPLTELAELRRKAELWDKENPPEPKCPWCGDSTLIEEIPVNSMFYWHCLNSECDSTGPYRKSRAEAIESAKMKRCEPDK